MTSSLKAWVLDTLNHTLRGNIIYAFQLSDVHYSVFQSKFHAFRKNNSKISATVINLQTFDGQPNSTEVISSLDYDHLHTHESRNGIEQCNR